MLDLNWTDFPAQPDAQRYRSAQKLIPQCTIRH